MTDTTTVKAALRSTTRSARAGMDTDERRIASAAAVERLLGLPELRRARTVLLYAAFGDELDPSALLPTLVSRGVRTLFPRVRGDDLELVAANDLLSLRLGYRGIREPAGPAIDVEQVELAIIPGVAFDVLGGRLGRGGGHYDRLLAFLDDDAVRVGVCFSCQVVPYVPCDVHDEPVDIVATQRAVYRTHARDPLEEA